MVSSPKAGRTLQSPPAGLWSLPSTCSHSSEFSYCSAARSCLTLCDSKDCSPPGFSVCGILQARILEWAVVFFSSGSSPLRDWTRVSCISCTVGRFFTIEPQDRPPEFSYSNVKSDHIVYAHNLFHGSSQLADQQSKAITQSFQVPFSRPLPPAPPQSPDQPDWRASTDHTTRGLAPGPCSHPSVFQLSELTPLQEAVSALCWEGSKAFLSLESEWLEQNPGLPFSRHLKIGKLITFFRHHIAKQEYLIQRYYENLMKSHT